MNSIERKLQFSIKESESKNLNIGDIIISVNTFTQIDDPIRLIENRIIGKVVDEDHMGNVKVSYTVRHDLSNRATHSKSNFNAEFMRNFFKSKRDALAYLQFETEFYIKKAQDKLNKINGAIEELWVY